MGVQQSKGAQRFTPEEQQLLFCFPEGMQLVRSNKYGNDSLSRFSIFSADDPHKVEVQKVLAGEMCSPQLSRCLGSLLGLAIGDSTGAPMEFSSVRYGVTEMTDMLDEFVWKNRRYNRFGLKPGQWTDDCSMSLALADSLIACNGFSPHDLRLRFLCWWRFGYCNAFGYDDQRDERGSVGLGGNIGGSFQEFLEKGTEYTTDGDRNTSGNGSIMRLAPVPLFYHSDVQQGMLVAYLQSKTTHQGDEAAECCRLLTYVIIQAINDEDGKDESKGKGKGKSKGSDEDRKLLNQKIERVLGALDEKFTSPLYSIMCLAGSKAEESHPENRALKLDLADRDWNWQKDSFRWSASRSREQPGYVGSYAMDCLAMALHCVWTTRSFSEAILKCANIRGDADTVTAVTGQIAGALYGVAHIPPAWIEAVQQWDNGGDIALRAHRLCTMGSQLVAAQKEKGIDAVKLLMAEVAKQQALQAQAGQERGRQASELASASVGDSEDEASEALDEDLSDTGVEFESASGSAGADRAPAMKSSSSAQPAGKKAVQFSGNETGEAEEDASESGSRSDKRKPAGKSARAQAQPSEPAKKGKKKGKRKHQ